MGECLSEVWEYFMKMMEEWPCAKLFDRLTGSGVFSGPIPGLANIPNNCPY